MSPFYYVVFGWFWHSTLFYPETTGMPSAEACDAYLSEQNVRWGRYFGRNPKLLRTEHPVSRWAVVLAPTASTAFFIYTRPGGRLMVSGYCVARADMDPRWDLDTIWTPSANDLVIHGHEGKNK